MSVRRVIPTSKVQNSIVGGHLPFVSQRTKVSESLFKCNGINFKQKVDFAFKAQFKDSPASKVGAT